MNYRRLYVPGGTYFFTLVTEKRRPILVKHVEVLRDALRRVKGNSPFAIKAIVILPDHLHTLWKLPPGNADFSTCLRLLKKYLSATLSGAPTSPSQTSKGEKGILTRHYDYIHYNPVKHGLVGKPADWEYSSFHKCVEQGLYPPHWGDSTPHSTDGMELE